MGVASPQFPVKYPLLPVLLIDQMYTPIICCIGDGWSFHPVSLDI